MVDKSYLFRLLYCSSQEAIISNTAISPFSWVQNFFKSKRHAL